MVRGAVLHLIQQDHVLRQQTDGTEGRLFLQVPEHLWIRLQFRRKLHPAAEGKILRKPEGPQQAEFLIHGDPAVDQLAIHRNNHRGVVGLNVLIDQRMGDQRLANRIIRKSEIITDFLLQVLFAVKKKCIGVEMIHDMGHQIRIFHRLVLP